MNIMKTSEIIEIHKENNAVWNLIKEKAILSDKDKKTFFDYNEYHIKKWVAVDDLLKEIRQLSESKADIEYFLLKQLTKNIG